MKQLKQCISVLFLAVFLAATVGCAPTSERQGTGEYIDDSVITTKVKAALIKDPMTKALEIKVDTYDGVVQLSGFVSSQDAADRAVELASRIDGVKSVKNDMRLK